jgi:hypothetical protein
MMKKHGYLGCVEREGDHVCNAGGHPGGGQLERQPGGGGRLQEETYSVECTSIVGVSSMGWEAATAS